MKFPFFSARTETPTLPRTSSWGTVEVRGGGSRLVCIPALGGRITEMEIGGRQWLWHNESIPFAPPVEGSNYDESGDMGGYDERFPTSAACRIPGWVRGWGGMELPDRGEIWSQLPEMDIDTGTDGQAVVTTWEGRRLPYRLTRLARVTADGAVVMTYHAVNDAADRIPFIWAGHPTLPLTPRTQIRLPEGSPFRVVAAHRLEMGDGRSQHRWPFVRAAGRVLDLLTPAAVAREFACRIFVEPSEGRACYRDGGEELEVTFDRKEVPWFGLWVNCRGWTPGRHARAYQNVAFEPCIGAPDSLSDALGDWKSARWLEPGEVCTWSTTWRARKVVEENDTEHHPG